MEPIVEEVKNALSKCESISCVWDVVRKYGFKKEGMEVYRGGTTEYTYVKNLPSTNPNEERRLYIYIRKTPETLKNAYTIKLVLKIINMRGKYANPIEKLLKPELSGEYIEIYEKHIEQPAISEKQLKSQLSFAFKQSKR